MRGMRLPLGSAIVASLTIVLSWATSSAAQTTRPEGAQQFAELGEFRLRNGSVIHDFRLGYRTLGKRNGEKSNAVLWPTWLGGK